MLRKDMQRSGTVIAVRAWLGTPGHNGCDVEAAAANGGAYGGFNDVQHDLVWITPQSIYLRAAVLSKTTASRTS